MPQSHPTRDADGPRPSPMPVDRWRVEDLDTRGTVDVTIYVQPRPGLSLGRIEVLMKEVVRRTDAALTGLFDDLEGTAHVDIGWTDLHDLPIFPMIRNGQVYEERTDVHEAIEERLAGTELDVEHPYFDAGGRAFTTGVWAHFRRQEPRDFQAPARLPGSGRAWEAP